MRIAGTSYADSLVNQLNYLSAQQFQLQSQISTGQRIQKPEEDPAGIVTAVSYQGNTRVGQREISEGTTVSVDVPGETPSGAGARGLLADSRYGVDFLNPLIALQKTLASGNPTAIAKTDASALI